MDAQGNRYLDAISSWWVNLHGHAHPYIAAAIAEQAHTLEHTIFTDFTHQSAVELAERLLQILPKNLKRVFYSDNGSTAVECALKMAMQTVYQRKKQVIQIIAFEDGYHGDTFGVMAAAGKNHFNRPFWPFLFETHLIPPPFPGEEEKSFKALKHLLNKNSPSCFLYEPLIQGAGGMRIYSIEGMNQLLKIAKESATILIADEVMTGFGRTGPLFASELFSTPPDLICLSKGITGGFLPLGATIASEEIFNAFLSEELKDAFLHGHSYAGNPLACRAGCASLDLLLSEKTEQNHQLICDLHQRFVQKLQGHKKLINIQSVGTILVIQCISERISYYNPIRQKILDFFFEKKILVRPLGNVLYLLPPYCVSKEDLQYMYQTIEQFLEIL